MSNQFDLTWSYHTSYLCVIVPSGRPVTSLEKTMWPFKKGVWYTVLFIVVFQIIFQIPIKQWGCGRYLDCIENFDFVRIYLGHAIFPYPTKIGTKVLVTGMFFYAMILRSCYQSSLFHLMALNINVSTINSPDDLIQENFKFYIINELFFVLETLPQIRSR